MKNQLIPLTAINNTPGEFAPALIPHGYKFRSLVTAPDGGRWTSGDHQGFSWVPELDGRIANQCGPVIRLDDGGLFMIKNADDFLCACTPKNKPKPMTPEQFKAESLAMGYASPMTAEEILKRPV